MIDAFAKNSNEVCKNVFATFFKITYEFKYQNISDCMKRGFLKTRFNPNIKFIKATVKK